MQGLYVARPLLALQWYVCVKVCVLASLWFQATHSLSLSAPIVSSRPAFFLLTAESSASIRWQKAETAKDGVQGLFVIIVLSEHHELFRPQVLAECPLSLCAKLYHFKALSWKHHNIDQQQAGFFFCLFLFIFSFKCNWLVMCQQRKGELIVRLSLSFVFWIKIIAILIV